MNFRQFNSIVEIRTKIISMGTYLSASVYVAISTTSFSLSKFIIMLFAVLFVDMGTTGFNTYFDFINGTDNKKFNKEQAKVLVHEHVNPTMALIVSSILFLAAAILGLILAYKTSFYLIIIGAICMGVGYVYTGGPFPISRTPFGEIFAGGFLGTILFLITYYVHTLTLNLSSLLVSLPFMIIIGMILSVNNRCDKFSDTEAGRRTLAIVLSEKSVAIFMYGQLISTFVLTILYSFTSYLPINVAPFSLVAFSLSLIIYKNMNKRGFSLETKDPSMGDISKIFLLYCLTFSLGLLSTIVF